MALPRRALALAALLAVGAGAGLAACGGTPPPDARDEAGRGPVVAGPARDAPAPSNPPRPADPLTPPDGRWLLDAQGREYFVARLSKRHAVRVDARTVRTHWSVPVDVVGEDAEFFHYKIYRVPPPSPPPPTEPSPEATRRVEDSYRVEVGESSRLGLVPFGRGLPQSGQWRDGFALADVNGDGHLDLVHGPARKSLRPPVIFLGDGQGGWRPWREATFPPLAYDYGDARVGDLNGDGHADLVFAVHLRGLIALVGDGRGRFTNASRGLGFTAGAGEAPNFSSRAIRLLDWNGDGRLDILALGEGPRLVLSPGSGGPAPGQSYGVAVYLNQTDGSWVRRDGGAGSTRIFGASLALGDFDGDGRTDFATGSSVLGRTDIVNLARGDGGWTPVAVPQVRARAYVRAVAAADFDGDGRADLAVAYESFEGQTWRGGVDVLLPQADGTWRRRALAAAAGQRGVWTLATGDLDGDGCADLVALTGRGELWVFLGDGRGGFTRERTTVPPFPGGCRGAHLALADLDGDGRHDIVASFADEPSSASPREHCPSQGGLTAWRVVLR